MSASAATKYAVASTLARQPPIQLVGDDDRQRGAVGERTERGTEPGLGKDGRVHATGELADVGDGGGRFRCSGVELGDR